MLLLINGAPGAGKSTLAQRYADDHALALVVDIDVLRQHLGQWEQRDDTKLVARHLALALAAAHLGDGHDVIIPQLVARPEFRARLRQLSPEFREIVVTDDADAMIDRFRRRRRDFASAGIHHPEADMPDGAIDSEIASLDEELRADAAARSVPVVSMRAGLDDAYAQLRAAL